MPAQNELSAARSAASNTTTCRMRFIRTLSQLRTSLSEGTTDRRTGARPHGHLCVPIAKTVDSDTVSRRIHDMVMLSIGDFARLGQVSPRMLRHYDEVGLIRPERVDAATGYRSYGVAQLVQLHKLLALRDLGFSLEQIGPLLREDPPVDQLRGMLRLRHAQIEQTVADEQARLRRVEAHLRALEGDQHVSHDIVIKSTQPVRVAEAIDVAPDFGPALGPSFGRILPRVTAHLEQAGVKPGIMLAWYEEPADGGWRVVHAGLEVGDRQHASST